MLRWNSTGVRSKVKVKCHGHVTRSSGAPYRIVDELMAGKMGVSEHVASPGGYVVNNKLGQIPSGAT